MPSGWVNATNHYRLDPAKLRALRHKTMLSQAEFQREFGIDIREFESAKPRKIGSRGKTVRALAAAFGVDPWELLAEPVAKLTLVSEDHGAPSASQTG